MPEKNEFPRISIVIPSYNKVKYIAKTLDSIVVQEYPNYEVIVQDGGSNDGTLDVIKECAKKFPSIVWESGKDRGQLDGINKGLKRATGKIVAYINADDVYLRDAFYNVRKSYLGNPGRMWFVGRGILIDEKSEENKSLFYRLLVKPYKNLLLKLNIRFFLLCTNYIMQPSVFLDRNTLKKFGLFAGTSKFVTEYKKWLDLSGAEMPVIINNDLSGFRMSADNITSTQPRELLSQDFTLIKRYTKNPLILALHLLNNIGRLITLWFVKSK